MFKLFVAASVNLNFLAIFFFVLQNQGWQHWEKWNPIIINITLTLSPQAVTIVVTVISLQVIVPVLSLQITFTQPRASTVGNFLTMACLFAILITPRARVTVVTIGRPSGIAATAKLTWVKLLLKVLLNAYLFKNTIRWLYAKRVKYRDKLYLPGSKI